MQSRLMTLAVVCAAIVGAQGCGDDDPATTPTPVGPPQSAVTINIPQSGSGISSFNPANVLLAVGGTVTWNNADNTTHNTTSNTNVWIGNLGPGGTFTRTFSAVGSFPYRCTLHPTMTGTITVQ